MCKSSYHFRMVAGRTNSCFGVRSDELFVREGSLVSGAVQSLLRCPKCKRRLKVLPRSMTCMRSGCRSSFPIVNQTPVLINEMSSVFSISDFVENKDTTFERKKSRNLMGLIRGLVPTISRNQRARENYAKIARLLKTKSARPKVLVLGGSILGEGFEVLAKDPTLEMVETDVSFGPRTELICDAHDLPFAAE